MDLIVISKKENNLFDYLTIRWSERKVSNADEIGRLVVQIGEDLIFVDAIDEYIIYEDYEPFFSDPHEYNYFAVKTLSIDALKSFVKKSDFPKGTWLDNDREWIDSVDNIMNNVKFYQSLLGE